MRQIKTNWLAEYLRYTRGNETPEVFHLWIGITLLAASLGRNVKFFQGHFDLYPNLYVVLVAGTADCHKSAAIGMGKKVLNKMDNSPRLFAQKITNQRLIQFLGEGVEGDTETNTVTKKAEGFIVSSELKSFLGNDAVNSGIIATLTDLYDPHEIWEYETKGSGKDILRNVCINLLGASTTKWLREAVPNEALGGGLISRTLFIFSNEPRGPYPHPQDHIPEDFNELRNKLANDLSHIRKNVNGYFKYENQEAKDWYGDWYTEQSKLQRARNDTRDFFSRWKQFLLKLAMLNSVAESDDLIITKENLINASAYLERVRSTLDPVVNTMIVTDSELPTAKVLGIIQRRDEITHRKLAKYTRKFVSAEGLRNIIETLEDSGEIEITITRDGKSGRIYKYTGGGGD